jgi:ABC-type polar amino acid transport system ATPase subunit
VVARLERIDSGEIEDEPQQPAMIFQEDSLWPHMTLLENVAAPLRFVGGSPRRAVLDRASALLERCGLKSKINAYPAQLSGGQKQRGALARALITQPRLLCLDEVTSGLDPESAAQILQTLSELKDRNSIVLMATHQLNYARGSSDQVIFLDNGRLVETGSPATVLREPVSPRVRQFINAWDYPASRQATVERNLNKRGDYGCHDDGRC